MTPEIERSPVVLDLELDEISKRFRKVIALNEASLKVRPGTIHALLGENGAGKTTLMRIAFGMITPDSGRICVKDHAIRFSSPSDAIAAG
ncbi:MAG: ATP-binding cassette domain-containing protein, partial [Acidobacteriota bacterium]